MNDPAPLPDLFEGFEKTSVNVGDSRLFCRTGGPTDASPIVLIHGYPQTHAMWHRIAPALAATHRVVVPDLRGYGWSSVPADRPGHEAYSKRAMAEDVVRLMEALGHSRFALIGHDRGARVGYRLALDHPGRLTRLALLDIVPTSTMWSGMDAKLAMKVYHWLFLAQPAPLPEILIGGASQAYLDHTLASWTKARDLSAFDPGALEHYRAFFAVPERLHATCEDYRAGATFDRALDDQALAAGHRIDVPVLVVWGAAGIPADGGSTPLDAWAAFADDLAGVALDCGHFVAEEDPEGLLGALRPFLAAGS